VNSYDAMRRYRELWAQYTVAPRGQVHPDLDDALRVAEENLIKYPPPGKSKGLIPGDVTLDCPTISEAFAELIPIDQWNEKIAERDAAQVSPFSWTALDQDGYGCHDSETEVLTEKGWTQWPSYDCKTALGTINPVTHALEFQAPTGVYQYPYNGKLYARNDRSNDFLVTPTHRMYVRPWNERNREIESFYTMRHADSLGWYMRMLAAPSGFVGVSCKSVSIREQQYSIDDFVALVAIIASCGYAGGSDSTRTRVAFCCFKPDRMAEVRALAERNGFREYPSRRGVFDARNNPSLHDWLVCNAYAGGFGSNNKRVPQFIKCLSTPHIKHFLNWYGDQHVTKSGSRAFYTSSPQMADDLQELLLRVGSKSGISERPARRSVMQDGRVLTPSPGSREYTIAQWSSDRVSIEKKKVETGDYGGDVFCATVPNGLLVTRRNKKILISGNSCAAEGATGCVLSLRDKQNHGKYRYKLNGFFPYHTTSGGSDRGSSLSDNIAFLMKYGVCTEEVWPRSNGPFRKPPEAAYENALRHKVLEVARATNKLEYGNGLLRGLPAYSGYSGHAWYGCDLVDDKRFKWKNSWGTSWGDRGFSTLAFTSVEWSYGVWFILSVTAPDDEV